MRRSKHHTNKKKQRFNVDGHKVLPVRREKPDLDALTQAVWTMAKQIQRESEDEWAFLDEMGRAAAGDKIGGI